MAEEFINPLTTIKDKVATRIFKLGPPDYSVVRSPEYQHTVPTIEGLYGQTYLWHGTGRYQYRDGEIIDVLAKIVNTGGLVPSEDSFDPMGPTKSVSTSPVRIYADFMPGFILKKGNNQVVFVEILGIGPTISSEILS